MISHRDLDKIRDNRREPGRENPRFTRWIVSDGEMIDVAKDIQDKGIREQPIRFARQIIGRGMASDIVFPELGSHIIEENISKMETGMVLREDNDIVLRTDEFSRTTSWSSTWELMAKMPLPDAAESASSLSKLAQ